eukprot:TRINITY_DN2478_c0_g1_i1.p1 TRINITY_DN2478_c0_g1~~TRINITY_DN2478_c0_g1_i1.p1  ORF type:complete len:229 (-),score=49.21 TRINITY_DN2478_c0_g1_i1:50-736(-)
MEEITCVPTFEEGRLSLIAQNLTHLPAFLGEEYGEQTTSLALNDNALSTVENLENFTNLQSLVLDNNSIVSISSFPKIQTLQTLWLNNNKIDSLELLLNEIEQKFPNLTYLSLLKNTCCPNFFVGKDSGSYIRYRYYVISRIPKLRFLDASPVTDEEREEAKKLSTMTARPDPQQYKKKADALPVDEARGLPQGDNLEQKPKASFGVIRYIYQGTQSEGNRFIVDNAL